MLVILHDQLGAGKRAKLRLCVEAAAKIWS